MGFSFGALQKTHQLAQMSDKITPLILATMDYSDENARMSFYDEVTDDEMDTHDSDSQLINEDSGLGSMSREKTVSLTSMFSQIRTNPILVSRNFTNCINVVSFRK
jgi:hypothetical protein